MGFEPTLAAIRFGYGLSPRVMAPQSVSEMMGLLRGPDRMAGRFPIPGPMEAQPTEAAWRDQQRARREAQESGDQARIDAIEALTKDMQAQTAQTYRSNFAATLGRIIETPDGFRERLVRFWADHFTVRSRANLTNHLVTPYVEAAIRPHVTGSFRDMLRAVVTAPMMLQYLDQLRSVGPNTANGLRTGKGLNENLAREMLELHTLGVGGPYTQDDVRQLAELLTGLNYRPDRGFVYLPNNAEPGAETVLGVTYDDAASVEVIFAAVEDLARHPQTARHLATKLAVHFLSDTPPADLIDALAAAFTGDDGALLPVYDALLAHPSAWDPKLQKVKQPFGFVASALRALGYDAARIAGMTDKDFRNGFTVPLRVMGQDWEKPNGPDGWPEEADAWVTPQGMAGRIHWALNSLGDIVPDLPEPRAFVRQALGAYATDTVRDAATEAGTPALGVGIVLSSAVFQRR